MTRLARPDVRFRETWAEAVAEFDGEVMHGSGLWDFDPLDVSEAGCAEVVAHLLSRGDPSVPMPDGFSSGIESANASVFCHRHTAVPVESAASRGVLR